jgi:glycosyltransferase 2 family protein
VTEMALFARALDINIAAAVFGAVLPLVLVASMIPFSIGGLGIREGTLVVLLTRAGLGTTEATLISILSLAALTLASAPCGVALFGGTFEAAKARVAWPKPLI